VITRYDWSNPDLIRMTIQESSYGGTGEGSVRITPTEDGSSRLHVERDNTDARSWQKLLLLLIHNGPMGRIVSRMWASALNRYAQSDLT